MRVVYCEVDMVVVAIAGHNTNTAVSEKQIKKLVRKNSSTWLWKEKDNNDKVKKDYR